MKRLISIFLILSVVFSGVFTVYADKTKGDKLSDDAVKNYVTEKGIWKNGEFEEDRAVTRSEFAGMLGRAIGVAETGIQSGFDDVDSSDVNFKEISALSALKIINGSNGCFRPYDTITREETAVIVERIYKGIFEEFKNDTEYRETRFLDFSEISPWAVQSIVNVCDAGIMPARVGRIFEPKEKTTVLEAAKIAEYISHENRNNYIYSVYEPSGDVETKYEIYQKAEITPQGMAGFGMVARFSGAPGEIYVSRTTNKPKVENPVGNPADPVVFARITDPDGNVIARVDLNYIESGKMAKVINIPDGKPGIWQIQIINGRKDDVVEIGINGALSWGIRGEPSFKFTETTPNEMYFWVPKKFKQAEFGATANFTIKDCEDATVGSPTSANRVYAKFDVTTSTLKPETAYKVVFSENSKATLAIMGVPKLLSPTKEMAEDLKGNYAYSQDGMQCHGPLQLRAREAALEIYNKREGDFSVSFDRPEELPENIENVMGEAYVMSERGIAAMNESIDDQCLDPESPYFGARVGRQRTRGEKEYPADSWEVDFYSVVFGGPYCTSAINLNAQLNYFYHNQALIDRATIYLLWGIYSTNDLMTMDDTTPTNRAGHNYCYTHSNFYLEYITGYYYQLKDYISPEYAQIIEEGLEIMTDKMMNFRGNGPSNQYTHSVISAMYMYLATGEERYHTYFKRGVRIAYSVNEGWGGIGMAPAGYCIEFGGCDGAYYHMNVNFMSHFHDEYCHSPMADPETVEVINDAINRTLKFETLFHGHKIDGLANSFARHFTSRTDSDVANIGGHIGHSKFIDEFPLAKRMWERGSAGIIWTIVYPYLLSSEEQAEKQIREVWDKYDHYYDGTTRIAGSVPMYDYFDGRGMVDSEPLPVEQEDGIHEVPGVIGIKHKGLYLVSFYNSSLPNGSVGQKCWYGGGPSLLTSENTSGVIQSKRHTDTSSVDGVFSSCIYGNNTDGSFFVSGKEIAELEWIEEGKKFVISGNGIGNGKKISWTYELTDDGVVMTPSVGALKKGEEYWVNLPITEQTNESFKYVDEPGKLILDYNGAKTTIEWDSTLEYKFLPAENGMKRLRIKLPSTGEVAVRFTTSR